MIEKREMDANFSNLGEIFFVHNPWMLYRSLSISYLGLIERIVVNRIGVLPQLKLLLRDAARTCERKTMNVSFSLTTIMHRIEKLFLYIEVYGTARHFRAAAFRRAQDPR